MKSIWKTVGSAVALGAFISMMFGVQLYADSRYLEPQNQHANSHLCMTLLETLLVLENAPATPENVRRMRVTKQRMADLGCAKV